MATISKLYKKHKGQTAYIVGTGPSNRVFPLNFLKDKLTIGLNQAYKLGKFTYGLTIHPYLIPLDRNQWNTKWITKHKPTDETWSQHEANGNVSRFFLFKNVDDFAYFSDSSDPKLCVSRGIQTGAIHLAGFLGCKYCVLVGIDCCVLQGEHHCIEQHIEYHHLPPEKVLKEYYYHIVKFRNLALSVFQMHVLSLTPFAGLPYFEEDFTYLKKQYQLSDLSKPIEIEKVKRTLPLVENYFS